MYRNVSKLILLLAVLAFFTSCNSFKPITRSESPRSSSTSPKSVSENNKRSAVIQYAKKYKGKKYKYGGKGPNNFDCSGYTSFALQKINITITPSSKGQAQLGKSIAVKKVQAGDLLFFGSKGKVSHVALVTKNDKNGISVIHSTSSKGVIEQNISQSSYWKPKILFARDVISQ